MSWSSYACRAPHELNLFEGEPPMMPPEMPAGPDPACPGGPKMPAECMDCVTDAECGAAKPACLAGRCVACTLDSHCPMDRACNAATAECTLRCALDESCKDKDAKLCNLEAMLCVACLGDSDCSKPDRPLCQPSSGRCVECLADANCSDAAPFCNAEQACVECISDTQCLAGAGCDEHGKCRAPKP